MCKHNKKIWEKDDVIYFELTQNQIGMISKEDEYLLENHNFYAHYDKDTKGYYVVTKINGKSVGIYNLIFKNNSDKNLTPDHISRNTLDNTRQNLRLATQRNQKINQNIKSNNKTGHKGVCFHKKNNCFDASIYDENSKRKQKSFSCKKFGYNEAKYLAIRWRKDKELEFGYYEIEI